MVTSPPVALELLLRVLVVRCETGERHVTHELKPPRESSPPACKSRRRCKCTSRPSARPAIERFRELMDEAPWNASIKDPEGHYLYLYRHYLATLGDRFGADWYGKTNADIWPPDNAARMREVDALALGDAPLPMFSLLRPFPDGPHEFVIMKFRLPTHDGRTVIGGVSSKVTEHARAEAEHDHRLRAAIEQVTESAVRPPVRPPAGHCPHRRHRRLHGRRGHPLANSAIAGPLRDTAEQRAAPRLPLARRIRYHRLTVGSTRAVAEPDHRA